jgi:hypothetical protein
MNRGIYNDWKYGFNRDGTIKPAYAKILVNYKKGRDKDGKDVTDTRFMWAANEGEKEAMVERVKHNPSVIGHEVIMYDNQIPEITVPVYSPDDVELYFLTGKTNPVAIIKEQQEHINDLEETVDMLLINSLGGGIDV